MSEVIFEERASKGIVKDFFTNVSHSNKVFKEPPYMYKTLMDMANADPVLSTALDLTVDLTTYKGYEFIGENKKLIKTAIKDFNDKYDFDRVIDNILYQILVYGDAYLEVRWNAGKSKVIELHPLETTEMKIDYDENGDINGYWQVVAGKTKENWIHFATDEVIYFRNRWIGSQVYSTNPFQAMSRDFATNVYGNNYLNSIFKNLPPKIIYFLKTANDKQRKQFIENLIRAKTNPNIDIIMQGEADSKLMQSKFDEGLISVLKWCQNRVLMITRVPNHWVGMTDGANRGIGENVVIPFETKIKKLQHKIASQLNKELMPAIGLSNLEFRWKAISLLDEKEIILNMGQLKTQGFDDDTVIEYGKEHGLPIRADAKIKEPELPMMGGPQIQKGSAPSRAGENPKAKMTNNINKKGVSAEGGQKLEKAQSEKK